MTKNTKITMNELRRLQQNNPMKHKEDLTKGQKHADIEKINSKQTGAEISYQRKEERLLSEKFDIAIEEASRKHQTKLKKEEDTPSKPAQNTSNEVIIKKRICSIGNKHNNKAARKNLHTRN